MGKVALNVPTMARNVMSNMVQMNLSGIPLHKMPGYMKKALQSMIAKDATWAEANRNGMFKTNLTVAEIGEVLNMVEDMHKNKMSWGSISRGLKTMAKFYGRIDDMFKLSKFIEQKEKGKDTPTAVREAFFWGMDYSLAHPTVKLARRWFMPFVSYQYKIAPVIARALRERPGVFLKYILMPYIAVEVAKESLDLDDDDWKKLKKRLPSFIKENRTMLAMPWKSPDGEVQWLDMQYFLPWGNLQGISQDLV
ncbi:unnamed protein product, partial [marine sediment metagenome]